ncbi:MAG: DUF2461 domain-containing protein [Clostridia bacterium]|nr:DUF2461 domain-containing protein [Clostridia bacterium]
MFPGFTEDTVQFFMDLRFHNEVPWMHAHHDEYVQKVQQPFYQLIAELSPAMLKIDPDFELRPAKCLSRINRDTRYSDDKSPYRDHHWIAFRRAGVDKYGQPFYWCEFGPDDLSWGVGIWGQERSVMNAFRLRLAHEGETLLPLFKRLRQHKFAIGGPSAPRMKVPADLPEELWPLYRMKAVYFERTGIDYQWAFDDRLVERVIKDYKTLKPVYQLLKECALSTAQEAPAEPVRTRIEDF